MSATASVTANAALRSMLSDPLATPEDEAVRKQLLAIPELARERCVPSLPEVQRSIFAELDEVDEATCQRVAQTDRRVLACRAAPFRLQTLRLALCLPPTRSEATRQQLRGVPPSEPLPAVPSELPALTAVAQRFVDDQREAEANAFALSRLTAPAPEAARKKTTWQKKRDALAKKAEEDATKTFFQKANVEHVVRVLKAQQAPGHRKLSKRERALQDKLLRDRAEQERRDREAIERSVPAHQRAAYDEREYTRNRIWQLWEDQRLPLEEHTKRRQARLPFFQGLARMCAPYLLPAVRVNVEKGCIRVAATGTLPPPAAPPAPKDETEEQRQERERKAQEAAEAHELWLRERISPPGEACLLLVHFPDESAFEAFSAWGMKPKMTRIVPVSEVKAFLRGKPTVTDLNLFLTAEAATQALKLLWTHASKAAGSAAASASASESSSAPWCVAVLTVDAMPLRDSVLAKTPSERLPDVSRVVEILESKGELPEPVFLQPLLGDPQPRRVYMCSRDFCGTLCWLSKGTRAHLLSCKDHPGMVFCCPECKAEHKRVHDTDEYKRRHEYKAKQKAARLERKLDDAFQAGVAMAAADPKASATAARTVELTALASNLLGADVEQVLNDRFGAAVKLEESAPAPSERWPLPAIAKIGYSDDYAAVLVRDLEQWRVHSDFLAEQVDAWRDKFMSGAIKGPQMIELLRHIPVDADVDHRVVPNLLSMGEDYKPELLRQATDAHVAILRHLKCFGLLGAIRALRAADASAAAAAEPPKQPSTPPPAEDYEVLSPHLLARESKSASPDPVSSDDSNDSGEASPARASEPAQQRDPGRGFSLSGEWI